MGSFCTTLGRRRAIRAGSSPAPGRGRTDIMATKKVMKAIKARAVQGRPAAGVPGIQAWRAANAAFVFAEPHHVQAAGKKGKSLASAVSRMVPVFLIEDNRLLRDGITAMLGEQGLRVIATARTAKEALAQVRRLEPHVVLLDSAIGDVDSLALVAAVRAASKDVKVVVMDLLPSHEDVVDFVRAGVSGFILKDATVEEFVGTIRAVADGAHVLPRPLTGALFAHVADRVKACGVRGVKAAVRMTKREREVVALIAEGASNREIAERLKVAAHTVKSHVHNILEKLALHTRLQVAAFAHSERTPTALPSVA